MHAIQHGRQSCQDERQQYQLPEILQHNQSQETRAQNLLQPYTQLYSIKYGWRAYHTLNRRDTKPRVFKS